MKKIFMIAALALCMALLAAPALAYEYLLEAHTDAYLPAPASEDDGYDEPQDYFYVGVNPLELEEPDWSSTYYESLAYAAIRQQIMKDLGKGVQIAGFNFEAIRGYEKIPVPQQNPVYMYGDVVYFPDWFELRGGETYNAYVPYEMFGGAAGDQIWVYTARYDYENNGELVIERVKTEKTSQYLITKHEHLTPVVFAWKPGNANLPNTGDDVNLLLLASAVMLSGAALIVLVARRRTA